MKIFRVNMRRGELAVSTISTVLQELERLTFGDMLDRLMTLSRDRKWVALLGVMADFAWHRLPKHKWMTQEQAMSILGWDENLVRAAFFRLTRRPRGQRARRLPDLWTPGDDWSPPWGNRYVLLLPSDPRDKAVKLAERLSGPDALRFRVVIPQPLTNPRLRLHPK